MLFVMEMGKVLLYLIMVVRVSSFFGYTTYGITGVYPQTTPGLVVPGNTSRHVCLILCGRDINCMSILTNAGQCHLFYKGFIDNTVLSPDPGWNLYNVYSGNFPYKRGYIENRELSICYKLHLGGPRNAYDFMATCASEGGELLRITSQEIQDHIAAFLADATCHFVVLIQGSDRNNEGVFTFEDGSALSYTNWYAGEPNNYIDGNGDDEDFIFLVPGEGYGWGDGIDVATTVSSFMCEIDLN